MSLIQDSLILDLVVYISFTTVLKLVKIDVEDNKNHKAYKQIDLGFSAERSLRSRQWSYALIVKLF